MAIVIVSLTTRDVVNRTTQRETQRERQRHEHRETEIAPSFLAIN